MLRFFGNEAWEPRRVKPVGFTTSGAPNSRTANPSAPSSDPAYFFPDLLFAVLLRAAGFFAVLLRAAGFFAAVVFLAAGFLAAVDRVAVAFLAVVFFAVVLLAAVFLAAGFFAAVVFFAPPVLFAAGFFAMVASSVRVDFALEPSRARSGSK